MNIIHKVLYMCAVALTLSACHQDEPTPVAPDLYTQRSTLLNPPDYYKGDVKTDCSFFFVEFKERDKYIYTNPVINPSNNLQFCYIRVDRDRTGGFNGNDLFVYDFSTSKTKLIFKEVSPNIDWSTKDWLLFSDKNRELWKVKSNGDSLVRLTNSRGYNNYPRWSPDGTKYLYFDSELMTNSGMRISNEDGSLYKAISTRMETWAWLNDTTIIYATNSNIDNQLRKYSLNSDATSFVIDLNRFGVFYISTRNDNIYLNDYTGLSRLRANSNQLENIDKIYSTYNGTYYQPLDENRYLLMRYAADTTGFATCIIYYTTFISILDKNNNTERKVNIPE
jgi:hypothetical protein